MPRTAPLADARGEGASGWHNHARQHRQSFHRAGADAFHVEVPPPPERDRARDETPPDRTPLGRAVTQGARDDGVGTLAERGGAAVPALDSSDLSCRQEPWLAASQHRSNSGLMAHVAATISNCGLMAHVAAAKPPVVRARSRVPTAGVVGMQSILSSGRPGARMVTVTSPGSPAPRSKASKGVVHISLDHREEGNYSPLLKKKLEARARREASATKIQALFRGFVARELVAALERAEVAAHRGGLRATIISCGGCPFNHATGHTAAVTKSGKLFTWGSAGCGQLGLSATQDSAVPRQVGHCRKCNPESRQLLSLHRVTSVALGGAHSVALTEKGHVYAWGSCAHGQLGQGDATDRFGNACENLDAARHRKVVPVCVTGLPSVTMIACGRYHTLALAQHGCVFSWGQGLSGQLGHGTNENGPHPRLVAGLEMVQVLACGSYHSAAVTGKGYACQHMAFQHMCMTHVHVHVHNTLYVLMNLFESTCNLVCPYHFEFTYT